MLRRLKSQELTLNAKIAEKIIHVEYTTFYPVEEAYYAALESTMKNSIEEFFNQNSLQAKFIKIFAWLTALRQACLHPQLINRPGMRFCDFREKGINILSKEQEPTKLKYSIKQELEIIGGMNKAIVERLKNEDLEYSICPICADS